jgi:Methyltransferase domain
MDRRNAIKISSELCETACVLDVGGGSAPFPRADYVLDARPFEAGSWQKTKLLEDIIAPRFSKERWVQWDVCRRESWPFPDKFFDYAVCSHLLEDVRDPVWVCSELQRVAKAGYIETPSRVWEQSLGVEHPRYAGFCHHRWLVDIKNNRIEFRVKSPLLSVISEAAVAKLSSHTTIAAPHRIAVLEWKDFIDAKEVLLLTEQEMVQDIVNYAESARSLSELVVANGEPLQRRIRRMVYFARLRFGW